MAFSEHYIIPFKSLDSINYEVVIYEDGYTGSTVTLTGAERPFETCEDGDVNPFTPIRTQTGYIRVIDEDGTLADSIFPTSNTQKFVRLYDTEDDSIKWQGFLACSAYNQDWVNSPHELDIPVISLLEAFKSVYLPLDAMQETEQLGKLLVYAMQTLFNTTDTAWLTSVLYEVWMIGSVDLDYLWPKPQIPFYLFFKEDEIINGDVSNTEYVGWSFYDIFQEICTLWGYTLRENGTAFFFTAFDEECISGHEESVYYRRKRFSTFLAGNYTSVSSYGYNQDNNLLQEITFAGDNSKMSLTPGKRLAIVSVDIDTKVPSLEMPDTPASDDTPLAWGWVGASRIQPFVDRGSDLETYDYFGVTYMTLDDMADSDWEAAYAWSTQTNPGLDNELFDTYWVEMYAMPCRISYSEEHLQSGLLVTRVKNNSTVGSPIYTLESARTFDLSEGGYLKLDIEYSTKYQGGDMPEAINTFIIKFAGKYWNVTSSRWQSTMPSPGDSNYPFTASTGRIQDNAEDFPEDEGDLNSSGYYIPIPSGDASVGTMSIIIPQYAYCGDDGDSTHGFGARVITKMEMSFQRLKNDLVSERTKNTYREEILLDAFDTDASVSLNMGTYNLNIESPTFLRKYPTPSSGSKYLELFKYGLAARTQRPEMALIERMKKYYVKARRNYKGTIFLGCDINTVRYLYKSSPHMIVSTSRRWVEGKEDVLIIELTADSEQ